MQKNTHKFHILTGANNAKPAPVDVEGAIEAVDDLVGWAFGLAVSSVDSRDDRERIRNARRYMRRSLRGRKTRCPTEDVLFTAGVLARVCESELGLPAGAIVRLLDDLELPTEVVPVVPRIDPAFAAVAAQVRRCPTPAPRTAAEEESHWLSLWLDDEPSNDGSPCACKAA